jgi:hypothetical protein
MFADSIYVQNLAPGETLDLATYDRTTWDVPVEALEWVCCFADRSDVVSERDETNNYQLFTPRPAPAALPLQETADLQILDFDFGPASPAQLQPGSTVTAIVTIANLGGVEAEPFWLEFWGSRLGGMQLSQLLLDRSEVITGLAPGTSRTLILDKPLMDVSDGPYTFMAVVDRTEQVAEHMEWNNRYAVAGKRLLVVRPPTNANLVLESLDAAIVVDYVGGPPLLVFDATIRNAGTEDSGAFWIEFWGTREGCYPTLDFMLCDSIWVENLAPGEILDFQNETLGVYDGAPIDTIGIGCFVDRADQVNETEESDNYRFSFAP